MEKTTSEKNKVTQSHGGEIPLFLQNQCNYFQEFIRAILKCLGFEAEPQNPSSNVKGGDETGSQSSSPSAEQSADPPRSSTADPPADPPAVMARRAPPSPPISGGRGPQTNANSS